MSEKNSKQRINSDSVVRFMLNNKALLILFLLMICAHILTGNSLRWGDGLFFTVNNVSSVARQIVAFTMLGIGFTIVLASGCVDLSVGHMLSFVGVAYAMMSKEMPLFFAIVCALAIGGACGLFNGLISEKLNLVPFIVTLATAQAFRG